MKSLRLVAIAVLLSFSAVAFAAPSITTLSPTSGTIGALVTITGSGFGSPQGTSTVNFNGTTATSITSWSDTQIKATVPTGATSGSVVVTASDLQSNGVAFTVIAPAITGLSVTSGAPGASVIISGSGFGSSQGAGVVTFNGQPAPVGSWSDSSISVAVPGGATTGNIVVSHGGLNSNAVAFTVAPIVTGVSPSIGGAGTSVTITGVNFTATQGTVAILSVSATVTSWSNTSIIATVPAAAVLYGPVTVTAGGMTSNSNVYFNVPPPHISSVSPPTGSVGTQITVNGSGFQGTQGNNSITINGSNALTGVIWSDTQITGTIAHGVGGPVQVTVNNVGSNQDVTFFTPNPVVTSVSPTSGTAGAQVTINGSGFGATQGTSTLAFCCFTNGSIVSWSDTQVVTTVPAGSATGAVIVAVGGVNSNSTVNFNVFSASIYSVTPKAGPIGSQVTLNGAGFGATQGGKTLQFYGGSNGNIAATIISWTDTQILATVPSAAQTGPVFILNGNSRISNADVNVTIGTVVVNSVSPTAALPGTQFQVNGSGFGATQGSSTFRLGNSMTPTIVSWSDNQVTAVAPASSSGTQPAVVTVNGVVSNTDVNFTILMPAISSISPTTGLGGTQVQINGNNFGATQGSSVLKFNGQIVSQSGIGFWSNTEILAMVPATAASGQVQVNVDGLNSSSPVYFTVPPPQVTSITPSIGGSGNAVTITGSGFGATASTNGANFTNGGSAAIASWSDTQIVATVPRGTTTGPVRVFAPNNQVSNLVNYTVPSLSVSTLSPDIGPVGTQVTIHGVGFGQTQGTSTLTFNGQPPASISSWNDGQIVATVPATAITGPVLVTANGVNSNNDTIFFVPGPSVNSVNPGGGTVGTQVTIVGSSFQPSQGSSTVTFNGTAVPPSGITSWSNTQIVVAVPAGATTGLLTVTVNGVSGSASTPFEVPGLTLTSLAPPESPAGGTITINGTGFGSNNPFAPVGFAYLNGTQMTVTSWSNTAITARVPSNASSGNVTVTKYDATSNALPLTIEGAPAVTSVSPGVGPVNGTITITGTGFGPSQSSNTVHFFAGTNATGPNAAVVSWSDTQIVATVPPGAATGPVGVVVAGVSGPTANFVVNTTVQVTDSLANVSSYTSQMQGGPWYYSGSTGSGCSSCTVRGNLSNTLDSTGNVLSHTDELGHVTSFTYDASNNLASQSAQLDGSTTVSTSYTYNSFGEPLTVTDPLGNVTTNTYDANGNLLTVTSPKPDAPTAASVTQFAYDAKGQLTQITDPLNHITTLAYYPTGLIHTITDAQSNVTSYEYDLRGNRTAVVDAQQNRTTFAYDLGDRLTGITYPDTTSVSFAYDSRGRRTSVTDQNGKVTSYAYDDADRLTSVTDAAQNVTTYAYDLENNLTSITDAAQHTTSFVYDAFGRVTQMAFPSSLTENYVYDAIGNLTSKVDRKNQTIQYVYDALNRLSHKGYPDATGVDYVYDLAGKIKQVSDPTGTYGFAYDNMGRLIGTSTQYAFLPGTPAPTFSNSYGYDAASNRTSFTAPDGSTNTYSYDTLGRLATLTNSLTGQFGFSYDALSRRTALNRPNGINTTYGYDSLSRLLNVLHKAGTVTLDGAGYTYDNAGNRTAKINYLNNITEQYTYDPLYQLTQVAQGATTTESYSYDAVGNRLSSLGMSPYAYNSFNELTSTPVATFTYDANGNTLTKVDSFETTTYAWDFENRLTSVALPAGAGTVTFKYDPFGRRIQKSSSSGTTNYLYDSADTVDEVDGGGSVLARYIQGPGIDDPLAEGRSGTDAFYEQDAVGSVTSLSSSTGTILNSYTYDTFGNSTVNGSFINPYRYTARDYDSETGLQYSRARYFDSQTGRFLSEDPLGFDASINFYVYVGNNPVRSADPLGLFATSGDKQPWDYRAIIHDLLRGSSKCADWFRKGKCSAVDIIDNVPIKLYTLNININQPGQTPSDASSPIEINTNGAFYSESPFAVGHEGPMRDPVYYSGTFGARMVILMHELAHKIGLPYEEFPLDQFDQNQSEKNTLKIIQLCRDAIKDIAKKWHETYSEIPK
jgi:RHS repeat-associated protein